MLIYNFWNTKKNDRSSSWSNTLNLSRLKILFQNKNESQYKVKKNEKLLLIDIHTKYLKSNKNEQKLKLNLI